MRRWILQSRPRYGASAGLLALLGIVGCASPGVPRPPSLHLPAPVRDLSAVRVGAAVQLHFTAPNQTTDHQPLVHKGAPVPLTAVVCRVQGAACLPVARLAVVPGQTVDTVDTLPPPLTIGPGRAVLYRVRVENPAGRDAGSVHDAAAAAGAAPAAVEGAAASTVAPGIQLTWQARPDEAAAIRVEAHTTAPGAATPQAAGRLSAGAAQPTDRMLQVPPTQRDPGGAIDTAPAVGARVTYRIYREREVAVNGEKLPLRGEVSTVRVQRTADVFAPAAPLGLLAVSLVTEGEGASVSLSWEPNTEADVTGYYVYRAAGTGPFTRVTTAPMAGVSFQDSSRTGLRSGTRVRYTVSAVDRNGNESARSSVTVVDVH